MLRRRRRACCFVGFPWLRSPFRPLAASYRIAQRRIFFFFETGEHTDRHARHFAAQIDELLRQHAGANRRLAVDRIEVVGVRALDALAIEICSGQEVTEFARMIKGPEEIKAMRCAVASCEASVAEMHQAMRAGVTENDVWAALHAGNIRRGGEWIETRILSSGPRTNPWFQESGPRVLSDGDLLSFDTDLIGTYGMCVDMSRSWIAEGWSPRPNRNACIELPMTISPTTPN